MRILNRWVIAVFAIGVALRLWVLTSHLGTMSADEAYTGLQAAAILDGRFPVVIDGMTYTAVAESYLYAPLVALSGVQVVTLKWLSAPGWLIAAGLLGWVVSRVAGRRAGMLAGAMVWLAPGAMLVLSTRAYVGYSTGLVAVTATLASCVIAVRGADRNRPDPRHGALAGGCAGLACYLHPMFATVALPMFAAATWPYRRHLRRWWLPAMAAAVGANSVFLAWNAVNGWPSLSQPAEATDTWLQRLEGFFTGLVPRALGLRTGAGDWVLGTGPTVVVYIAVLLIIAYGAVVLWRRDTRSGAVVIAPLIMSWPLMASLTNLSFVADGRYGIITFPLLVTALAVGLEDLSTRWRPNVRVVPAALALWVLVFCLPWLGTEAGDDLGDPNEHVQRVVDVLDEAGMRYALGTYWWVLPIEVISDGRIRTGTLGHPDVVLLPRTQRLVESVSEDELAYVFSPEAYAPELLPGGEDRYRMRRVAGAVVAIPLGASPPR
jgi:hypothetical protein